MTEMTKQKEKILVYEPVAEASGASASMAARPESLNGKSVGLINNTKDFTDEILGVMGAALEKQFPGVRVVRYRKESVSGASRSPHGAGGRRVRRRRFRAWRLRLVHVVEYPRQRRFREERAGHGHHRYRRV